MIRARFLTKFAIAAWVATSAPAISQDVGTASQVGNVTGLSRKDSRNVPSSTSEGNIIGGLADSFAMSQGDDSRFILPSNCDFIFPNEGGSQVLDLKNKTAHCVGDPVVIFKTDTGIEIFAKELFVDGKTETVTLTGDLSIFQKGSLTRSDKAVYNYKTRELQTSKVGAKVDGIILMSDKFNYELDEDGKSRIVGYDASITAEDDQEPDSWISGRKITIYPEESIAFTGMKAYYSGVPFFYFPYFAHSLNPDEGYLPNLGTRSNWGPFFLNKYGILFGNKRTEKGRPTADYLATLRADYRVRRGFGLGVDLEDVELNKSASDMTGLSLYGVDDIDPTISPSEASRPRDMDKQRWRLALQNMWDLPIRDSLSSQWRLKANINAMSDQYVLRDFFENLYQSNPEPDNTVAVTRTDDLTNLIFYQRIPMNDFYLSDQRTELYFDRIRAPLFGSDIIYESQTSASFMRQYLPSMMRTNIYDRLDDPTLSQSSRDFLQRMLMTNGYFRAHTYHELSTSYKAGGVVNFVPKVGGGFTGYRDVDELGSFNQGIFYAALDTYLKFSRKYDGVRNRTFGLNGLNHIIQPYTTFAYIGANEADPMLPRIDGYSASTNPIALSPGRITEIDSMATSAVLRYGVKNFLMTERDGGSVRWFSWDMFMDAYLHDAADDQNFSNLYSTMTWTPLPWLTYANVVQFPVLGEDKELMYREYNNYLSFAVTRSLDLIIGHRYLSQHPMLEDSSQADIKAIYRINEEFAVSGAWRWEMQNGQMDIQEYQIHKNLGSWYFGTGIFMRRNGTKDEIGFGFSFTLKEAGVYMPVKFY